MLEMGLIAECAKSRKVVDLRSVDASARCLADVQAVVVVWEFRVPLTRVGVF